MAGPQPVTFNSASEFHTWLQRHHDRATELVVRFRRRAAGGVSLTYPAALDEALCFGWIDGVRRSAGPDSYTIRFTPRRPGSIWSRVNIGHAERLIAAGRMQPAGANAFAARSPARSGLYSFENKPQQLPRELEQEFQTQPDAWSFFVAQPPGYRRTVIWWIVSARQDATRRRRLAQVIRVSARRKRVDFMSPFRDPA